jgi:hypothetical protein
MNERTEKAPTLIATGTYLEFDKKVLFHFPFTLINMTSSSNIDDDDGPALVAARRSGVRHTVLIANRALLSDHDKSLI